MPSSLTQNKGDIMTYYCYIKPIYTLATAWDHLMGALQHKNYINSTLNTILDINIILSLQCEK